LNENIVQHLNRQGMKEISETLIRESGLPKEDINEDPFAELHKIYEDILNEHNLRPAIDYATKYSSELNNKNSSLEFKLHRLAFVQILRSGGKAQNEAIEYARLNLSKFAVITRFQKDFQMLMGCLLYLKVGLENSPYKFLLRDEMWIECADVFLNDSCMLAGINKDSPLAVIVNSGCLALPSLLNLRQVMNRQVQGIWNGRDELPVI
jgi:E3 ubiquitin-protein transferase RMND5